MEQEKKCSRCGRILPLSEFYKKTRAKDGHQTYCKKMSTRTIQTKISNKNNIKQFACRFYPSPVD